MALSSDQEIDLIAEDAARVSSTTATRRLGQSNDVGAIPSTYLHRRFRDGAVAGERRVLVTLGVVLTHLHHQNAGFPATTPEAVVPAIEQPREPMELCDDVSEARNSTILGQDSRTMVLVDEDEESAEPMETSGQSSSQEAMELDSSSLSAEAVEMEEEAGPSQSASPEAMETSGIVESTTSTVTMASIVEEEEQEEDQRRASKRKLIQNDGPVAKRHRSDDSDSGESITSTPAADKPEEPQPAPSTSTSPSIAPVHPVDDSVAEADIAFYEESQDSNGSVTTPEGSNRPELDSPTSSISTPDHTVAEADVGFIQDHDEEEEKEEEGSENPSIRPLALPKIEDDIGNETAGTLAFRSPPAKIGKFDCSEDSSASGNDSTHDAEPEDAQNVNDDVPDAPIPTTSADTDSVAPIPTDSTQGANLDDKEETAGADLFKGPVPKSGRYDDSSSSSSNPDNMDDNIDIEYVDNEQAAEEPDTKAPTSPTIAPSAPIHQVDDTIAEADIGFLEDHDEDEDVDVSAAAPTPTLEDDTLETDIFKGPTPKRGRFDESEDSTSSNGDEGNGSGSNEDDQKPNSSISSPDGHILAQIAILDDDTPGNHAFDSPPRKMGRFDGDSDDDESEKTPDSPASSHYGDRVASTPDASDNTPGAFAFDTPPRKVGRFDNSSSPSVDLDATIGNRSGTSSPVGQVAHPDDSLVADAHADADADSIEHESDDDQHAAASDFDSDTLDDQGIPPPEFDFDDQAAQADGSSSIDVDSISYSPSSPDSNSYLVRSFDSPPSSPNSNSSMVNSPDAAAPPPRSPMPAHPDDDGDDEDPDDPEDEEDPEDSDDDDDDIPVDLQLENFSPRLLNVLPGLIDQDEIDSCDDGRWIGGEALWFALLREATTFNLANVDTGRRCAVLHTSAFEEAKRLVEEDAAEKERMKRLRIRGPAPATQINPDIIARWVVYGNQWSEMLIPINIGGTHWALVVVKRQSVQAVVLDSNPNLQDADQKATKEMVKAAVKKVLEGIGALNLEDKTTSRYKVRYTMNNCRDVQPPRNGDCGIYVISHARKVLARTTFNGKTKVGERAIQVAEERNSLKRMLIQIRREYGGQVLIHQPGRGTLPCTPKKVPVTLSYSAKR